MSTPRQLEEMSMSEIAKDLSLASNVKQSEEINMSENAEDEEPPESHVEQSEEINMSEKAKDEAPPESNVKPSEEDGLLQLEIQKHGIIQANWKHWQQITKVKPNLKSHFSSIGSAVKFIIKLVLVGIR